MHDRVAELASPECRDEIREIIDFAERQERHAAALRDRYGTASSSRAVVELGDWVEIEAGRVIAEIEAATRRGRRELVLLIDSPGGDTKAMFAIIDALERFRGRTIGVVLGRASSAAATILARCEQRIGSPASEYLVHCCGWYPESERHKPPRITARNLDRTAANLGNIDQRIGEIFYRGTGSKELRSMIAGGEDHRFDAAEARRLNLLTAIEPDEPIVTPGGFSIRQYFSPKRAELRSTLASMSRSRAAFVAVRLVGEIGPGLPANARSIRRQLAEARDARTMLITVDSIGGSADEAAKIYGLIAEHPATRKKASIGGHCASAALIPLLAANIRVARPGSEILLHRAALDPWSARGQRWTAEHHALAAEEIAKCDTEMVDLLVERTGGSREFFERQMQDERPMRLVDALSHGLIHEIAGQMRPVDASWPSQIAALARAGAVMGLPSYYFSKDYLAACRAAGPARRRR